MNDLENKIIELIELLGSNVDQITYSTTSELWTIEYKNNFKPDEIETDYLIEFLTNA